MRLSNWLLVNWLGIALTTLCASFQAHAVEQQTIVFPAIPLKTFGDQPFSVNATASSGLIVQFTSQTTAVCTVSGITVTLLSVGTCTIAADQLGNSSFFPASQVVQSFLVNAFSKIQSAPLSTLVFSNAVSMSAITGSVNISIAGGEYSIGCTKDFVSVPGTISAGSLLCLRHLSSVVPLTSTITTVTVGQTVTMFESQTEPPDTTPEQFHFNDVTNVALGSSIVSLPVPIQGINVPSPVSVTGGEYSIGCTDTFTSNPGTVSKGDSVCIRLTAASSFTAVQTATLTVGGLSDQFSTLTRSNVDTSGFSEALTRIPGIDSVDKLYRDPTSAVRIIATTATGFAVSEDAGLTWTNRGFIDGTTNAVIPNLSGLTVDTSVPGRWYGMTKNQLYRSADYGKTWTSMGLDPLESELLCMGVSPVNPQFLVIARTNMPQSYSINFYVSQTGGGSWSLVTTSLPVNYKGCEFAFDKISSDSFLFLNGSDNTTIYRVNTTSKTVVTVHTPTFETTSPSISSRAKSQDTKSSSQLWLFTQCVEDFNSINKCQAQLTVDSSADGGQTISRRSAGSLGVTVTSYIGTPNMPPMFRLKDFSVDAWLGTKMGIISDLLDRFDQPLPTFPPRVVLESVSGGSSWQRRPLPDGVTTPSSVLAMSTDGDGALLASTEKGIYRKRFGEDEWQNSSVGLKAPTVSVVAASRASSTTILIGTAEAGLYLTTNGGNTWNSANKGLPPFSNIASGCFDSDSDMLGYAVVGTRLFRTTDRATTWTSPPSDPPLTNVRGVYCPRGKPNVVYAAGSGGLFTLARSDNAGLTWTNIDGLDGAAVNSLAPSPGTDTIFVAASSGLFRSTTSDALTKVSSAVFTRVAVSPTNLQNVYAVTPGDSLGNGIYGNWFFVNFTVIFPLLRDNPVIQYFQLEHERYGAV
jgi:hypothetical protein